MSGQDASNPAAPKIIIDSDWKSQAQAEKERLSQKVDSKPAAKPAAKSATPGADMPGGDAAAPGEREEVGFQDVVSMLASQALMYMGFYPDPQTGQAVVSLEYARLHIDMLGVIEAKTKGNLDEGEQQLITKLTGELRTAFVETSHMVAKAVKEGKVRQMGGPGAGAPGVVRASGAMPGAGGIIGG